MSSLRTKKKEENICITFLFFSYFLGLRISGAISLAFDEVNSHKLKDYGHQLEFLIAETYGEEVTSIRQTANLWTKNITAYIGPQETCVHEGRMAAAFNLPMISYVSFSSILVPFNLVTCHLLCLLQTVLYPSRNLTQKEFPDICPYTSTRHPNIKICCLTTPCLQLDTSHIPLFGIG